MIEFMFFSFSFLAAAVTSARVPAFIERCANVGCSAEPKSPVVSTIGLDMHS